jgi:site-specific DNA recombinase
VGVRAAVYCRISDDREGAGLGVARQEADCRALAKVRGWEVVEVFIDNDLSAYSGKVRPDYRRLLSGMKAREFDAVITWHTDRLHRSPRELEDFITVCDGASVRVETVQAGNIDLSTPSGRMVARMLGSTARYESEHKSERIKRKALEAAQSGKPWGGSDRPFGFEADRITVRESEAKIIRELATRFLAGESLSSLCKWLAENNITTTRGGAWKLTGVARVLGGARWSGQREHHGEIIAKAVWPAIITPEETARIRAILDDPERRTNRIARSYLLAGLLRCGKCSTKMVARPTSEGVRRYVCPGPPQGTGCGHMFIKADTLEQFITEAILYRLDSPELADALAGRVNSDDKAVAAQAQMTSARAKLVELAEMFALGEISRLQLLAAQKVSEKQLAQAEKILAATTQTTILESHIGNAKDLASRWDALNLNRQKAIVATLLDHLKIGPAVRGRKAFDPERLKPVWRL